MCRLHVLGAGKVFYGLGADLNNRGIVTVAFTTKHIEKTHQDFIQPYDDEGDFLGYPALYIADDEDPTELASLLKQDIKIFIVNIFAHKTLIENCHDLVMLSSCKEGILTTYASILNASHCSGSIICIDNDKTIAERAKGAIKNFIVNSSVIDMYCPKEPETKEGISRIYVRRNASIVFPPNCNVYKQYFHPSLSSSLFVRFSKSNNEYEIAKKEKLYNINIPHTIMATQALDYFIKVKGEKKSSISNELKFSDIPLEVFEKMKMYCLKCHFAYCRPLVIEQAHRYNDTSHISEQMDVYVKVTSNCIEDLYKSGDSIVRIIDPNSMKSLKKLNVQLSLIIEYCPNKERLNTIINELGVRSIAC